MKWITRSNIKVDRVACSWLIRRLIDPEAEFIVVPESELLRASLAIESGVLEGIGLRALATGFAAIELSDEERLERQFPLCDALDRYAQSLA